MNQFNRRDRGESASGALSFLPDLHKDENGPVFAEPWQADVFAITVSLYEKGLFTWQEWASTLSQSISRAQENSDPDLGDTYYHHWLDALECIIEKTNPGAEARLATLYQQWETAACNTPHGQPIEL